MGITIRGNGGKYNIPPKRMYLSGYGRPVVEAEEQQEANKEAMMPTTMKLETPCICGHKYGVHAMHANPLTHEVHRSECLYDNCPCEYPMGWTAGTGWVKV